LRAPRKTRERFNEAVGTKLDSAIASGRLKLAVDSTRGLVDEWAKTCGTDVVHVLVAKWESQGGIVPVGPLGKLSRSQRDRLFDFGFTDTCDKLIVKIAYATGDRIIVTDDSDFWDPKTKKNFCNSNAPVALLLVGELGITLYVLKMLITVLFPKK
jgi:hypothetical protein